jgi:hypothetical protein
VATVRLLSDFATAALKAVRRDRWLSKTGVADVEKLTRGKTLEKTLRWDALQTTFAPRVDIFYPQNFGCFEQNRLFQHQPQAITLNPCRSFQGRMTSSGLLPPLIPYTVPEVNAPASYL